MTIIERLQAVSDTPNSLDIFISSNLGEVYDSLNNKSHENLIELKDSIRKYIALNWIVLRELDPGIKNNLSFLSLLIDLCERLNLTSQFGLLYNYFRNKDYDLGHRIRAASLYLIGLNTSEDFLNVYDSVYINLKIAYESEEDNINKVLATFVNYFAQVILDFGSFNFKVAFDLREKINRTLKEDEFSFLHQELIYEVLQTIELSPFDVAYQHIHSSLDTFLGNDLQPLDVINGFLIETGTEYCDLLQNVSLDFNSIREISKNRHVPNPDGNKHFKALGRGVRILTDLGELDAYMCGYGPMHYHKLISAFPFLPKDIYDEEIDVIDWGCGQGMATMSLLNYLIDNSIYAVINTVMLIEPSEVALKRASLHVRKFNSTVKIQTINKDLDSLDNRDIQIKGSPNIHLFSNILDVDAFSLTKLIKLVNDNFTGDNYFICVSPYITSLKTDRMDIFMKGFFKNNFQLIKNITNKSGEWQGEWTRALRIFKVSL